MASTQTWSEFNGANAATETTSRAEANWKNVDDSTTAYTASVITAGNNSFGKYQALKFAGAWNSISAFTYKVSSATPATGASVVASVINAAAGTTPATAATGDSAASTTGTTANLASSSTPYVTPGTASSTASGTMYAQAYRTQLQTTGSAGPGDIPTVTIIATWTES